MSPPGGVRALFGWRKGVANIADSASSTSTAVSKALFERLDIRRGSNEAGQTLGSLFEGAVRSRLSEELPALAPYRRWQVGSRPIVEFAQYAHLARIADLLKDADPNGTLRAELGMDYIIKPDVTVGVEDGPSLPFLHAAVSCKWTIRSDRVQNIRHEGVVLTRHRRGRQPHVVTVTAEPLPSRIAAIARGTGEVDCVYHAELSELHAAVRAAAGVHEFDTLEELIEQDRLRPLSALPEVLAFF
jgi:hypothetical protein